MKPRLLGVVAAGLSLTALSTLGNTPFIPGGADSVGLTNIVPDTVVYNTNSVPNFDNWEPYVSVLGNSVFLITANTFAESSTENQRFALVFQPVDGGAKALGDSFYGDDGTPFRGQINASRQDGNPGRVAGDKRPGAVNFIAGGEASPDQYTPFQSPPDRWKLGFDRTDGGRYGTVQTYKLNTANLSQTPLAKAFDAADGRLTSGASVGQQNTRFGGDLAALDNGNFVIAVEDRTKVRNPDGNAAVAVVIKPDGTIVKDSFMVATGDLWSNVAAYKNGFAVRVAGIIYFYDNDGNAKGQVDQDAADGTSFSRDRGDDTRIAGHINSPYVYLAGVNSSDNVVRVAAYDSRNQAAVAVADVSEADFAGTFARVHPAVDALDRVVVAYDAKIESYEQAQIAMRVFALDATAKTIKPLTKSFFPFLNHGPTGFTTADGGVAMTTRQILVAGKGLVNSTNNIAAGPNTLAQTTVYTVLNHPAPADDPTTPVQGEAAAGMPSEFGKTVNGFQDDFTGATRDPNWVPVGPGGDHYVQTGGVLQVSVSQSDPNHLIYMGPGSSNSVQEVLARMRVVGFGANDDGPRGGIAVGVNTNVPSHIGNWTGMNVNFRDFAGDVSGGPNRHFRLLDDNRAWGPQLNTAWTNNVWYWVRLRMDPKSDGTNDYFGKVWVADGSTAEPGDWQLKWPDAGGSASQKPLHSGWAGITGCSSGKLAQLEVDYVLIKSADLPSITVNFAAQGPAVNPPNLKPIERSGTKAVVSWFGGTLQAATAATGTWNDVANTPSPNTNTVAAGSAKFFRVRQ